MRLRRAIRALDAAGVPYAVAGGNAVAEFVGRLDEEAVRSTPDIDLLLRRADLPAAVAALETVGFLYHTSLLWLSDSVAPSTKRATGIHLLLSGEGSRDR